MKILKSILLVLLILIAIPLIAAIFIPKDFAVARTVVIDKPKDEVFAYIKHLKNQNNYGKWNLIDPNMKNTYTGEDGKVGFVSAWESENDSVGIGEQEILKIVEGERIETELRFTKPFDAVNYASMATESIEDGKTKVVWGFSGSFPYPMNLMLVFMDLEGDIGGDFEEGLQNLKNILETGSI